MNDTEVTQVVKVTNHSPMDVKYQWSFVDSAIQFENKEEDEGMSGSMKIPQHLDQNLDYDTSAMQLVKISWRTLC